MKAKIYENIIIREATNRDSGFIINLIFDIWINEYHFEVKKEDFPDLQEIENYYAKENGLFLVAVVNGEIVGTIACNQLPGENFVLKRMFVNKNYRGLGIAQMLLNKLFELTITNNNIVFFLSTKESEAIAAKKFYLKNGFRIISKTALPKDFPFFYQDDLFMLRDDKFIPKV